MLFKGDQEICWLSGLVPEDRNLVDVKWLWLVMC